MKKACYDELISQQIPKILAFPQGPATYAEEPECNTNEAGTDRAYDVITKGIRISQVLSVL